MLPLRQVKVYGCSFELRSLDGGRSWSSSPADLIRGKRRREKEAEKLKLDKLQRSIALHCPDEPPDYLIVPRGIHGGRMKAR